ncbi:MAG: hypothetical protein ACREPC_05065 [Stenotrophomonas sp.]|uniref:hypothetical protein n=1 Tax=Stenotrophomonas sp. TaxID=69392 RepID=UPI003D6D90C5
MNIYAGLLFLQGHIADAGLARRLAEPAEEALETEVPAIDVAATQQNHVRCVDGDTCRHGAAVS